MFRLNHGTRRLFCIQKPPANLKFSPTTIVKPSSVEADKVEVRNPAVLTPIARYVPTDPSAFLVESHRLTGAENFVQGISSVFPWLFLCLLGVSPYFLMKHNLDSLKAKSDSEISKPTTVPSRYQQILPKDMPEILERRTPTFVVIVGDNFHSMVYLPLLRDLSKHHSICVLLSSTCSKEFLKKYPESLAPHGHVILPGYKLIEFEKDWNGSNLAEFLSIKSPVNEEVLDRFEACVFKHRFVVKNWTLNDSLSCSSLDEALARCEALAT